MSRQHYLSLTTLFAFLSGLVALLATPAHAFHLGLPWGADQSWATQLEGNAGIHFYHTWQNPPVTSLSQAGMQWVPMRWGDKKNDHWPSIQEQFPTAKYPYLLAYNEPDVSSQSDYTPSRAANAFQEELAPLRQWGAKISSPQICWNVKWLQSFLNDLQHQGGEVDFLAVHYYGSWKSLKHLQRYMEQIHAQWPDKKIWVTEYGVTSSSNPSAAQAKQFMIQATQFFASTGYVEAAFPFGMFSHPPDSFGSRQNAAFTSQGSLRSIGRYYKHFTAAVSRRSIKLGSESVSTRGLDRRTWRRHQALLRRLELSDAEDEELWDNHVNTTHCDTICQNREAWLASVEAPLPSSP